MCNTVHVWPFHDTGVILLEDHKLSVLLLTDSQHGPAQFENAVEQEGSRASKENLAGSFRSILKVTWPCVR